MSSAHYGRAVPVALRRFGRLDCERIDYSSAAKRGADQQELFKEFLQVQCRRTKSKTYKKLANIVGHRYVRAALDALPRCVHKFSRKHAPGWYPGLVARLESGYGRYVGDSNVQSLVFEEEVVEEGIEGEDVGKKESHGRRGKEGIVGEKIKGR